MPNAHKVFANQLVGKTFKEAMDLCQAANKPWYNRMPTTFPDASLRYLGAADDIHFPLLAPIRRGHILIHLVGKDTRVLPENRACAVKDSAKVRQMIAYILRNAAEFTVEKTVVVKTMSVVSI